VFKVETIGDCYVAVTGIPRPQDKHYTIMIRFAHECRDALQEQIEQLAPKLGEQTLELAMRVGIHSGPVTGGVLRGEKARFQLFGDTMNTAARMESNGMKGRIHVSEDTANLLIRAGKGDWVTPREEKIVAKGKGEMQTYWVEKTSLRTDASSNGSNHDETTCRFDDETEFVSESIPKSRSSLGDIDVLESRLFDRLSPGGKANDNPIAVAPQQQQREKDKGATDQQEKLYDGYFI